MAIQRHIIPAGHGAPVALRSGQHLRLIDPEGGQSGDLFALSRDGRQRLSNGRTFDFGGTIYLSTGNSLVDVLENGRLQIGAPRSRAGDAMVLRADIDLAIALSACPAATCNGGGATKPIAYEVFD